MRVYAALVALILVAAGCANDIAPSAGRLTASPPVPVTGTDATSATVTPSSIAGIKCGVERWPVKTVSDDDAAKVNFVPVQSSVAELRSLRAPAQLPESLRITPAELTVFTVTAQMVEFKLEDDRDVHLVIAEPGDPSATMIVEFPNADDCAGAVGSAHAPEMRTARAALIAAFGQPHSSEFTVLTGTATITGVGFFDFLHGQRGVAPNGFELHPVLAFIR